METVEAVREREFGIIHGESQYLTIIKTLTTFTVPRGYKPPVFLEQLEAILTAEGTVSLECKVVGVPTPALKWFKDGVEIRAGEIAPKCI